MSQSSEIGKLKIEQEDLDREALSLNKVLSSMEELYSQLVRISIDRNDLQMFVDLKTKIYNRRDNIINSYHKITRRIRQLARKAKKT
ncbi:MAG: hypothetical protein ACFFAI_12670 [Promethearchaeota archaeon]